jgi:hypothetical protein
MMLIGQVQLLGQVHLIVPGGERLLFGRGVAESNLLPNRSPRRYSLNPVWPPGQSVRPEGHARASRSGFPGAPADSALVGIGPEWSNGAAGRKEWKPESGGGGADNDKSA